MKKASIFSYFLILQMMATSILHWTYFPPNKKFHWTFPSLSSQQHSTESTQPSLVKHAHPTKCGSSDLVLPVAMAPLPPLIHKTASPFILANASKFHRMPLKSLYGSDSCWVWPSCWCFELRVTQTELTHICCSSRLRDCASNTCVIMWTLTPNLLLIIRHT